jgi:hypothetical protein
MRRSLALVLVLASCKSGGAAPKQDKPETMTTASALTPSPAPEGMPKRPASPSASTDLGTGKVAHYRVLIAKATAADGRAVIVTRAFDRGGVELALTVSLQDLKTQVMRMDALQVEPSSWEALSKAFERSPYLRALADANQHASALQDAGITHVLPEEHGVVLTVDLCPSRKSLDEVLFKRVVSTFTPEEHPVPIALAITGVWMQQHAKQFAELVTLAKAGKLDITWINHSYHHRYDPKLPLPQNFLLEKGTKLEDEVLLTEIALIDAGVLPSVMFRFPGLISDPEIVHTVVGYGLIPIGSDAWLAKKERAKSGDIVLVHGNGNEPAGISAFLALLSQEKKDIKRRQFLLLDIREGIEEEEEK